MNTARMQNKEKKKHGPNERTHQNFRKRTKQNGGKQSIRCRVQNTGYKMLKGLNKDLNSIEKIQSKGKDTLIEIKKTTLIYLLCLKLQCI